MTNGQQPFGGVGRLRLSVIGFAEPRLDKGNDSRLFFVFIQKIGEIHCVTTGADSIGD